jgi:hypothetical protein
VTIKLGGNSFIHKTKTPTIDSPLQEGLPRRRALARVGYRSEKKVYYKYFKKNVNIDHAFNGIRVDIKGV